MYAPEVMMAEIPPITFTDESKAAFLALSESLLPVWQNANALMVKLIETEGQAGSEVANKLINIVGGLHAAWLAFDLLRSGFMPPEELTMMQNDPPPTDKEIADGAIEFLERLGLDLSEEVYETIRRLGNRS
jgi:hypothetical protein